MGLNRIDKAFNINGTFGTKYFKVDIEDEGYTLDDIQYDEYWNNLANGKMNIPYGMTEQEYTAFLKGIDKVKDYQALQKVDYDEILKLRRYDEYLDSFFKGGVKLYSMK